MRGIHDSLPVIARSSRDEAIHSFVERWIASRSLSSGGHSADPLARNDVGTDCQITICAPPPSSGRTTPKQNQGGSPKLHGRNHDSIRKRAVRHRIVPVV